MAGDAKEMTFLAKVLLTIVPHSPSTQRLLIILE